MKKLLTLAIVLLLTLPIALAGVTNPLPPEIELLKGEQGRFKFQIQNLNRDSPIDCYFELQGESELVIEFDDNSVTVDGQSKQDFYGTVSAPSRLGDYSQTFCVKCTPKDVSSGASVRIDSCGLPIVAKVVTEKHKENMTIPPKPLDIGLVVLLAAVAIAALIAYYYFKNNCKACKAKAKAKHKRK